MKTHAALFVLLALTAGCSSKPKKQYYQGPERTVAVLPPFHIKPEVWKSVWPAVEAAMARKGYTVLPRETVEGFSAQNRFTIPKELTQYTTEELAKELEADLILYTHVLEWGKKTLLIYNKVSVKIQIEIVDAKGKLFYRKTRARHRKKHLSAAGVFLKPKSVAGRVVYDCFRSLLPVPPPGSTPTADPPN